MIMYDSKKQIFDACRENLLTDIHILEKEMNMLKESASTDNEGGMSDHLESTDAEMMNDRLDRENHRNLLYQELSLLDSLNKPEKLEEIEPGAVVITSDRNFFIAIARNFIVNEHDFIGVSVAAPIFRVLAGKKKGDTYKFNDQEYTIKEVY